MEHQVVHYKQNYNWDCGVSCVIMLLNDEQREYFLRCFEDIVNEEGFNNSTWTIDLCYLLKRFNIKHRMYTTSIGPNENYRHYHYYDKIFHMDVDRVTQRFREASSNGIDVQERSLSLQDLFSHLSSDGPALVLVDGGLLVCDLCKHNKMKAEFRRCFRESYKGHYILVVGYTDKGKLLYHDPTLSARLCIMSRSYFQQARLASGTDEDLILIYSKR